MGFYFIFQKNSDILKPYISGLITVNVLAFEIFLAGPSIVNDEYVKFTGQRADLVDAFVLTIVVVGAVGLRDRALCILT